MQNQNDKNNKILVKLLLACPGLYMFITLLNFSKYGEQQILGWNLPQKFMIGKYFEKLHIKTKSVSNNVPLSQYGEH